MVSSRRADCEELVARRGKSDWQRVDPSHAAICAGDDAAIGLAPCGEAGLGIAARIGDYLFANQP